MKHRHDECIALLNKVNKPASPGATIITQLSVPKPISTNNPPTPLKAVFALLADMDADCPYTNFDFKAGCWRVEDTDNIVIHNKSYYVVWINCVIPLEFFMALMWQAGWQVTVLTWELLACSGDVRDLYKDTDDNATSTPTDADTPPETVANKELLVDDYEMCTDDELDIMAEAGDDFAKEERLLRQRQRSALAGQRNLIVMPQEQVQQALILHAINKSKLN